MSFQPLPSSTASLSTTDSGHFTETSDSTGPTSEGKGDSSSLKRDSSAGDCEDEGADTGGKDDEMVKFLSGSGWHDRLVPPIERLKHLCRLLDAHYDLTGGDYYGQCTYHACTTLDLPNGMTQPGEHSAAFMSYLTNIGVDLDFLEGSNDISSDPMEDLINEAFCHHGSSLPEISKHMAAPISRWEIDWNRPLPKELHAYWETLGSTRSEPIHVFTRAKPILRERPAAPRPYPPQEHLPEHQGDGEKVDRMRRFRAVLHKVGELVTLY